MTTIFWICLLGGFALAALLALFGDAFEFGADADLDLDADADADSGGPGEWLLDPLSWVAGIAVFGGAGIVLTEATALTGAALGVTAAAIGLILAVTMHFAYVRRMKNAENSTGFSVREYAGKLGEVGVTIPATGYGEVQVKMGASTTFQTAASFTGTEIARGTAVVVVEVASDGTLLVSPFAEEVGAQLPDGAAAPQLPRATTS